MSHLNLENLARLVDEAPTALEAAHLAACEQCRSELQQLHVQTAELGALPALEPTRDEWTKIERRLLAEGLIRDRSPRRVFLHYGLRAAAAVALLLTGMAVGRSLNATSSSAGAPLAAADAGAPAGPTAAGSAGAAEEQTAQPVGAPLAESPAPAAEATLASNAVALASNPATSAASAPRAPRTPEEALQQLRTAELTYLDALTRFAELSGSRGTGDPAARLAALEGIVLTTRAALGQAPTDPVINGYHLTALAQRDATLKQIASTNADSWF